MRELYLDNASTTPMNKEVMKRINFVNKEIYGNPSSVHSLGEKAYELITESRREIGKAIEARAEEIIFTSGATEADNWAIFGMARAHKNKKKILISSLEHPAVREAALKLKGEGYKIIEIPISKDGIVDLNFIKENIDSDTLLVSVMHVSNVLGSIQPIGEIGKLCRTKRVFFHTDAAQSFGKIKIDVNEMNIDLLSGSAHKIGGPKGIGFLYVNAESEIEPMFFGGGQERGLRSGTENTALIAGFSKAVQECRKIKINSLRNIQKYCSNELEKIGGKINNNLDKSLAGFIHVSFKGMNNEIIAAALSKNKIYVSTGSACDTKKEREDNTLIALGLNKEERNGSIRISLPYEIKRADIDRFIEILKNILGNQRLN